MKYLGLDSFSMAFLDDGPIEYHIAKGWTLMEGPQPTNGIYYAIGTKWVLQDLEANKERKWRDSELTEFVDPLQKVLVWEDLTEEQKNLISIYRRELLDYPGQVDFPNGTRPVRPNI